MAGWNCCDSIECGRTLGWEVCLIECERILGFSAEWRACSHG